MRYYTALELQKRKQRRAKTQAAKKIQRWWRPFAEAFALARQMHFKMETRAAVCIQRNWRRSFIRNRLTKDLIFLVWLKARRRGVIARFRRAAWLTLWKIRFAVRTIQKHLRSWWTRCLKRRAHERKATTIIQRNWRSHRLYHLQAPLRTRETEMIMVLKEEQLQRRIRMKGCLRELELIAFRAKNPKSDLNETLRQTANRVAVVAAERSSRSAQQHHRQQKAQPRSWEIESDQEENAAADSVDEKSREKVVRQRLQAESLLGYAPGIVEAAAAKSENCDGDKANHDLLVPSTPQYPSTSKRRHTAGGLKGKAVTLGESEKEEQQSRTGPTAARLRHVHPAAHRVVDINKTNSSELGFYSAARSLRDPENWVKPNISQRIVSPYSNFPEDSHQNALVPNVIVWRLHKGSKPAGALSAPNPTEINNSSSSSNRPVAAIMNSVAVNLQKLRRDAARENEVYREDDDPFESDDHDDNEEEQFRGANQRSRGVRQAIEVIVPRATGYTVTLEGRELETHH